ncbi:substrate-binding periplasmic protein [Salinivibrio socompensis]|uniref:substrate-binding periplasmic protein n=1 Tax=Salinivibrio socompensis TaxID=1510206 RepID=UPI00046F92BB|nr:transporter substrate-binding domain-containing protein [Salinivibrio socompensis]
MAKWWVLVVCWLPLSALGNTFTIAYRDHTDAMSSATKAILERAFYSVDPNIDLSWIEMPFSRAEDALEKGIIDADFGRTRLAYQSTSQAYYPTEPLLSVDYYLFGYTHVLDPTNYQRIVGVIGDKIVEEIAEKYQWEIVRVRTERAALKMVNSNRVQAMVGYVGIKSVLKNEQLTAVRMGDKPVESIPVYLVVHKRHQTLVEPLDAALREMKDSGEFAAIFEKHGL